MISAPGMAERAQQRLRSAALLIAVVSTGGYTTGACADAGLFGSSEPLEIRIEAPWRQLTRRMEAGRSAAGKLIYGTASSEESSLEVSISTRGTSRLEVCDFPLLTLEMRAEEIVDSPFAGQRVVHLTTQCRREPSFRDNLVLEYLSYQAYRLLGEPGLGVRMALVDYLDTEGKRSAESALAFFLEDLDLAAARLGGVRLEPETVPVDAWAPETLALLGLFQFMLGNTDWSAHRGPPGEPCCHNLAVFGPTAAEPDLTPVPFDLDSTGLVDPPYAAPVESLPIDSVRQRLYRGFCASNSLLPAAVARIQATRADLVALFENGPFLDSSSKKRARKYLDSYFDVLDDPKKLKKRVLGYCR